VKGDVHFTVGADGKHVPEVPAVGGDAQPMYWALGAEGRVAFDREAGINDYADPEIGEAYVTATEREMPDFEDVSDKIWNYHWAGVVMKDGSDNITLEAAAVTWEKADAAKVRTFDYVERHWKFARYGGVGEDGEAADRQRTFIPPAAHGNRRARQSRFDTQDVRARVRSTQNPSAASAAS